MVSPLELRRAVVIEDDPDIRGLLVRVLTKQGFVVTHAGAGLPGVEEAFIIMLAARADELDKLTGLDNGADEYISSEVPHGLPGRVAGS